MKTEKTIDVTALGELLIDFTPGEISSQGFPTFEANPGGAPCNVLAMLAKLGRKAAFIGKVGDDMFGRFLKERTLEQGICMDGLLFDKDVHTTLAFVQKLPNGDRDFSFYRKPGADIMITRDEVIAHKELIEKARIFHFGTLSMTDETAERATVEALSIAKDTGALISFDPNYRAPLWDSEDAAKEKIAFGLRNCDILKISDNEIELMTGTDDIAAGVAMLKRDYGIPLIFATLGPDGSSAFYKDLPACYEAGFVNPDTVETTGAGDTFCACALHHVLKYGLEDLTEAKLHELLVYANAAASLVTTRRGALCVMPDAAEVEAYRNACKR